MNFEIIDFHTHPYTVDSDNTCVYTSEVGSSVDIFTKDIKDCGISIFAGSVIAKGCEGVDAIKLANARAFELSKILNGTYVPGIQIDPRFKAESINEIEKAVDNGVKLVGELVPYFYNWKYDHEDFESLIEVATHYDLPISMHTVDIDAMEYLADKHKNTCFVFAHPGEKAMVQRHVDIMKKHKNVYLDLSGTGLFRFGMLAHLVQSVGADRILFGTDYPICNPFMYVGGVMGERISDSDRKMIFADNAKRILKL